MQETNPDIENTVNKKNKNQKKNNKKENYKKHDKKSRGKRKYRGKGKKNAKEGLFSVLLANVYYVCPFILFFYVYGDITAQLIEWASMLKDVMASQINTEAKLDKVKKYMAALLPNFPHSKSKQTNN